MIMGVPPQFFRKILSIHGRKSKPAMIFIDWQTMVDVWMHPRLMDRCVINWMIHLDQKPATDRRVGGLWFGTNQLLDVECLCPIVHPFRCTRVDN